MNNIRNEHVFDTAAIHVSVPGLSGHYVSSFCCSPIEPCRQEPEYRYPTIFCDVWSKEKNQNNPAEAARVVISHHQGQILAEHGTLLSS